MDNETKTQARGHTPGPWQVITEPPAIKGVDGDWIADTGLFSRAIEEAEANARLIAAAPELLEAAVAMDALMDNLWEAVPWGDTFNLDAKALNDAPLALKSAIAKARGEE